MRFTLASALLALPLLVAAAPQPIQPNLKVSLSKRTTLSNADGSVNYAAIAQHIAAVKAKYQQGFANYEKNTGSRHPSASALSVEGVQKRSEASVRLNNTYYMAYFGNLSFGTPARQHLIDFDTGSSDLFLAGPDCPSCQGHNIYDPSQSRTSQPLGKNFSITYGSGACAGEQYTDVVAIDNLVVRNQTLGVANNFTAQFTIEEFAADGLMGMGFRSISVYNASNFVDNLASQGQIKQNVFSMSLADSGAELTIGGENASARKGPYAYAPITIEGFYQINADGISATGNETNLLSNFSVIIDSGTSVIVGPPETITPIVQALGAVNASATAGPGFWSAPCDNMPNVTVTVGGTSFALSAESMNLGTVETGSPDCALGIMEMELGVDGVILGDVFLRNVYTMFDTENKRVGFARLA